MQDKDLTRVYSQLYTEKLNQYWLFSAIKIGVEDPDDTKHYDSSESEEDEEAQETDSTMMPWGWDKRFLV